MAVAIIAGLFGLFGTIIGATLATWTARQTADRSERRAWVEARRQEYRSVVIRFASAVLDYRRAAAHYYNARRDEWRDRTSAGDEAYRSRSAASAVYYQLRLSTNDAETVRLAESCLDAAYKIQEADSQATADDSYEQTLRYLDDMISAARKAQPGWLPEGSKIVLAERN